MPSRRDRTGGIRVAHCHSLAMSGPMKDVA
jgi:hypothetical protein